MLPYPTNLALEGARLAIDWSDGRRLLYDVKQLREACPCATCREKRGASPAAASLLPVLSPEELTPLAITAMRPVGNYAYTIAFTDGHDTGIYSFERLLEIGDPPPPSPR